MPAYGKKLSPAEVDALVSFMATLHSTAPARPSSKPENNLQRDVAAVRPPALHGR
jgi:mono/diheme cytochrome c family protein